LVFGSPKSAPLVDGTILNKVTTQVGLSLDVENIADVDRNKDNTESQGMDNNTAFENCSGVQLVSTCPAETITLTRNLDSQPVPKDANTTHPSTAAMKSVSILKTVWGDLVDEETSMSDEQMRF